MDLVIPKLIGEASVTRATTATMYDINSLVVSVPAGVARVGYDPRDLRNVLLYSSDFNNAAWSNNAVDVIATTATLPPTGVTETVYKTVDTATTAQHFTRQFVSNFIANRTYTYTVYAKAAERTSFIIGTWDGVSGLDALFSLFGGGSVSFAPGQTCSITNVGNGWYRCRVTRKLSSTASTYHVINYNGPSNASYLGDGTSGMYLCAPQLERGNTASTYISTPVTRHPVLNYEKTGTINYMTQGDTDMALTHNLSGLLTLTTGAKIGVYEGTAPDGTRRSTRMSADDSNTVHFYQLNPSIPSGPQRGSVDMYQYVTFWAKADECTKIGVARGVQTTNYVAFDLDTGVVSAFGTETTAGSSMVYIGNDWWKITARSTLPGIANNGGTNILLLDSAGASTFTGPTSLQPRYSVLLWGFQYELTSIANDPGASSYMQNTDTWTSRASAALYYNSAGNLVSAASGVQRLEYNPDLLLTPPKLLLEPASTNLCLQSSTFSSASWSKTGVTVDAASILLPTGSSAAGNNQLSATAADSFVTQTITGLTVGRRYTFSVYMKMPSGPDDIDLYIVSGTVQASQKFIVGTTWKRYYVSYIANATSCTVQIGGGGTFTTGQVLQVWGAQLENPTWIMTGAVTSKLESPTSLMATTTTTASRVTDAFTYSSTTRGDESNMQGLFYSNVPENDYPVWDTVTDYAINAMVIYQHKVYKSLRNPNMNINPATDTSSPPYWQLVGPTNRYAMFDTAVGTQTVAASPVIVEVFMPSGATLSFNNVECDTVKVDIRTFTNDVLFSNTYDLTGGTTGVPVTDYTVTDIPLSLPECFAIVTFTKAAGSVKVGNFVAGTKYYLGSTETSPTVGIIDYSVKTTDSFGNPTLTVRPYSKRMNAKVLIDTKDVDMISRLMASARATACVWDGNNQDQTENKLTSLIVYGFFRDFEIEVAWTTKSYLNLTIEGLI